MPPHDALVDGFDASTDASDASRDGGISLPDAAGDSGVFEDAGLCSGDFAPEGTLLDVTGWLALRPHRVPGGWQWLGTVGCPDCTYRVVRAPTDLNTMDTSLVAEGLPLVLGARTLHVSNSTAYDSAHDAWLIIVYDRAAPGVAYALIYGSDGHPRGAPLDITPAYTDYLGFPAEPDGDGFVALSVQTPTTSTECWSEITHLRVSVDGTAATASAPARMDGYAFVRGDWRGDHWIITSVEGCGTAGASLVLWDLSATGGLSARRALSGALGVQPGRVIPGPASWGLWDFHSDSAGGTQEVRFQPFDPLSGGVLGPASTIFRSGAGYGRLMFGAEGTHGFAAIVSELVDGTTERKSFVRFSATGEVVQNTVLAEGALPYAPFLLQWVGDRFLAGWTTPTAYVLDELLCAGS